jgi:6-phosphofructokinase 2
MYKIATITFSPCIDKSTTVEKLLPDKKLYCSKPELTPGGGGINVARAIKKLGGEALAIYPEGGYSGHYLNQLLKAEGIAVAPVIASESTRENLMVLDEASNLQYRFGMPASTVLESEWLQCLTVLSQYPVEYVIVSGSLPPGVPTDLVARIVWVAKKKEQKLIADIS